MLVLLFHGAWFLASITAQRKLNHHATPDILQLTYEIVTCKFADMTAIPPSALTADDPPPSLKMRYIALILGPVLALVLSSFSPPDGLPIPAWYVCALAVVMVVWWVTEAMPLAVTALLPIAVLPLLDVLPLKQVVASFGNPIIFLFLGGFLLSAAMQKWKLHLRLAYMVASRTAFSAPALLAGLMAVTCFLALWISNTATVIMMLPIAMSVATVVTSQSSGHGNAPRAIALGVAYASAIGGLSSFIGTPTNALLYGHMQTHYNVSLNLGEWMLFGVPCTIGIAGTAWFMLMRADLRHLQLSQFFHDHIREELAKLGPMHPGEKRTLAIFTITVLLWLFSDTIAAMSGLVIEDAAVAIMAAIALFLTPVDAKKGIFTLEWKDAERVPWGVLIFFGGSLALSSAFIETGVSEWLGAKLEALRGVHPVIVVVTVVVVIIAASEMMSNVATISVFLPILSVLAEALHVNPMLFLLPATLAASCGFMMPGASAPNALAYSTGYLNAPTMVKKGFWVDVISVIVITCITFTIAPLALDMDFSTPPSWANITLTP